MNKVLKLQRIGLMTPTAVEYKGKILATNQLDIESTCNLWRNHFGFYPTERIDLAMTEKDFSVIQQKPLASSKSVYELFCEQNFIPRVFEITEKFAEWGIYRNNEVDALKTENAALRERLEKSVELPTKVMIERTIVNGKLKNTQKAQAFNGRIGVVYRDETKWNGLLVDICSEKSFDYESAEARLAELKGEEK